MYDPNDLREQARRRRRAATARSPAVAEQLILAAEQLEDHADAIGATASCLKQANAEPA
jgi:hypothetical protein